MRWYRIRILRNIAEEPVSLARHSAERNRPDKESYAHKISGEANMALEKTRNSSSPLSLRRYSLDALRLLYLLHLNKGFLSAQSIRAGLFSQPYPDHRLSCHTGTYSQKYPIKITIFSLLALIGI